MADDEFAECRDLIEGQGDVTECGCGWPITEYLGRWLHVYNDELIGTGDHEATPN